MRQTLPWREATAAVKDKSITDMLMNGDHHIMMLRLRVLSRKDIIIRIQLNNQYDLRHFRNHSALIHTRIIIQSLQKLDPQMTVVLPMTRILHIVMMQARKYR